MNGAPLKVRLILATLLGAVSLRAEVVRTLRTQLPASASVRVENLVGTLTAVPGTGSGIVVTATIHAENAGLADAFALRRPDDGGPATLRVRYPDVRSIRYPGPRDRDSGWSFEIFDGNRVTYDGRRYRVSRHHGDLAYADVLVEAPSGTRVEIDQITGLVRASDLKAGLSVNVHDADMDFKHLDGAIELSGTSGDTKAVDIGGPWRSTFTSGDCSLARFHGARLDMKTTSGYISLEDITTATLSIDTTSGDVEGRRIKSDSLNIDVTSGDVALAGLDAGRLEGRASSGDFSATGAVHHSAKIRTSSGNVEMDLEAEFPEDSHIETSSGDVHLRLPVSAAFDLDSRRGSGDLNVDASDLATDRRGEHDSHLQKGSGGARIELETGSGDQFIRTH